MADSKQLAAPQSSPRFGEPAAPRSRRRFLALGGGSTALPALLAACGSDSSTTMKAVEPFVVKL